MPLARTLPGIALLGAVLLAGCSNFKEQVGVERKPPDEFSVVTRPPLSLPPNYSLRPPRPGERRPQEPQVRDQARGVLLSSPARPTDFSSPGQSAGETALLAHARTESAEPDIRQLVARETNQPDDRNFVERLMFWIDYPPPGDVVDARKESQRLQENAALGRSVTTGETPTIVRKPINRGITLF